MNVRQIGSAVKFRRATSGSTVRFRAVVDALVRVLTGGESLPLPDLPRIQARGIGFSDWHVIAELLAEPSELHEHVLPA